MASIFQNPFDFPEISDPINRLLFWRNELVLKAFWQVNVSAYDGKLDSTSLFYINLSQKLENEKTRALTILLEQFDHSLESLIKTLPFDKLNELENYLFHLRFKLEFLTEKGLTKIIEEFNDKETPYTYCEGLFLEPTSWKEDLFPHLAIRRR